MSTQEPEVQDGGGIPPSAFENQLARYTIHVPIRDANQRQVPHILSQFRKDLTKAGFPGRTVIPQVQADWRGDESSFDTEEMALVMVDAPDDPNILEQIKQAAQPLKEISSSGKIYLTIQPLRIELI